MVAGFGIHCGYRFVCTPSGGVTYYFSGFRRKTRTGAVSISGGREFGWLAWTVTGGFAGSSLREASHCLVHGFALIAIVVMIPICRWFRSYLNHIKKRPMLVAGKIERPLSSRMTVFAISILLILIFSKYIYMASLTSYYTFYLIHKFGVTVQASQLFLFVFLVATAIGTLVGGPVGDRIGRKYVIWASILGTAPFSMMMPHVGLAWTVVLSFCVGLMLSSAFPAILLYAQELLPNKLGLISGLFFGFAFGIAGIASAVLGGMADKYGIEAVYNVCAFMPLLGLVACFLPNLKKR
ncbi:putative fosmidomycin resistance protein [Bacteroides sp. D20]|nr:putative fosmidomycin resistance protein [Bacteroides sp. D20]